MKQTKLMAIAFLGFALVATGCSKKSNDQASLSGTGFDSLSTTEELAQLPQNTSSNQQAPVEVLPIETAPVTQSATTPETVTTSSSTSSSLTHEQQIQTALKNAGLYEGNIDGKIGPKTKKAIEQFQTNNGLKADGKVGPKTWTALEPYLTGQAQASSTSTTTSTTAATE